MAEREQVRPLAPASDRPNSSSDDEETASHRQRLRRKRLIRCCSCVSAVVLILAAVIVTLIFTVFRVKDPIIRMNGVTINQLDFVNGSVPRPGSNMTVTADVSVKNPNYASFRYKNTTTALFYHGTVIGEARGPPGKARARRTMRMNVTADIIMDRIISNPNLGADMNSGLLPLNSYTRVGGRVKLLKIVKKHITVTMNCTVAVNITSQGIQELKCKRKVDL